MSLCRPNLCSFINSCLFKITKHFSYQDKGFGTTANPTKRQVWCLSAHRSRMKCYLMGRHLQQWELHWMTTQGEPQVWSTKNNSYNYISNKTQEHSIPQIEPQKKGQTLYNEQNIYRKKFLLTGNKPKNLTRLLPLFFFNGMHGIEMSFKYCENRMIRNIVLKLNKYKNITYICE